MTWQPSNLTRWQLEERRMKGVKLLQAGKLTQKEIAKRLGVSRVSVSNWKRQLEAEGRKGLKARKSRGRPAKLSSEQQQDLVNLLSKGAIKAGYPTERWTLKRIQQVIRKEYRVTYHPKYLNRLLRHLGWTPQVPLDQAAERDEVLIRAWLKQDWPRIKKIVSSQAGHRVYG
jgi:putative transposase